jgi:hypothetical protein
MQHAPGHGDGETFDLLQQVRGFQCFATAFSQGQVDGATGRNREATWIGEPLVQIDRKTTPGQQDGQQ